MNTGFLDDCNVEILYSRLYFFMPREFVKKGAVEKTVHYTNRIAANFSNLPKRNLAKPLFFFCAFAIMVKAFEKRIR